MIKTRIDGTKGQSLVEMAIIAPILIMIFLGLVDVGRYMIAHQYLIGVSRDLARYGIREDVIDYYATKRDDVGYDEMKSYLDQIMQPTIAHRYDLDSNVQVRISLLRYSTGPIFCLIDPCVGFMQGNTVEQCRAGLDLYEADDEQSTPDGAILWLQTYGQDYDDVRPLDYSQLIADMRTATIAQGCRMEERSELGETDMLEERRVMVEIIYTMDWWFVPYGDPIIYHQTSMRTGK